ncbi:MAG: transcriptional regulator GcvA [Alphaproteobacteria bacterium]
MTQGPADRLPSLRALKAFETAARHGSFITAADELCVTPSAISHQVRQLEAWLGTALFRRTNRGIELTPDGQGLLPGLTDGFDRIAGTLAAFRDRHRHRRITVSVFPSIAMRWLLPHLHEFYAANPDVEVRIATTDWHADFARDDIDCAFRFGEGDWPGLEAVRLYAERLVPVCAPGLETLDKPLATAADLASYRLLHARVRPDDWALWLAQAGLPDLVPAGNLTFETRHFATQAAVERLGVALADEVLVADDLRAGRLVIPFPEPLSTPGAYYFVCEPSRRAEPALSAFREWVVARIRQGVS